MKASLNKLPGDSVSYIRRDEMRAMFWHGGSLYEYDPGANKMKWVRDLPEDQLRDDERAALNKRRDYFGTSGGG